MVYRGGVSRSDNRAGLPSKIFKKQKEVIEKGFQKFSKKQKEPRDTWVEAKGEENNQR